MISMETSNPITFTDEILIENMKFLKAKKKTKFKFDENGQIRRLGFFEKIFLTSSKKKKIKEEFNLFTSAIKINPEKDGLKENDIKEFFFNTINSMNRKFYTRNIDNAVFNFLEQEMALTNGITKTAQCWAKLGNVIASEGGCGTSYRVVNKEGKSLGIFKPSVGEPLGEKNTKLSQRIKIFVLKYLAPKSLVGSLFQTCAGQGFIAEVAQKQVAEIVQKLIKEYLNNKNDLPPEIKKMIESIHDSLVPTTEIAEFQVGNQAQLKGSFQEWINEDHQDASKFFGYKNKNYNGKGKEERLKTFPHELFDLLVIIDFVTGNSDRHGENWFITTANENKKTKVTGIRLIDGGWSMAPVHPSSRKAFELGNQYKWKNISPLANQPFTDFGKFIIASLDIESMSEKLRELYTKHSQENEKGLIESRLKTMKERILVMKKYAKDGNTKSELATVTTLEDFSKVLSPVSN